MRALVLHPGDSPFASRWSGTHWDAVLDLGTAGPSTYAEWSNHLRCPVSSLIALRSFDDPSRLRDLLNLARGKVVDDLGLDWWELNCVFFYQQLDQVMLLVRVADELQHCDEVVVSCPGLHARVLQLLLGDPVRIAPRESWPSAGLRIQRYGRVFSNLSFAQLAEICGDKFDPEYSLRRRFAQKATQVKQPVVLFPSAYSNASRMLASYARVLPDQQFLLVATRRSASLFDRPPNVQVVSLAAYANSRRDPAQLSSLLDRWNDVLSQIQHVPEWELLKCAGVLDGFPHLLNTGLAVRDTWLNVLQSHEVTAVFSGDEGNPYVCIPLKLAAARGTPTLSVHHGALDGRFALKHPAAEWIVAKSRMELDYLARCGLDMPHVVLGAPGPHLPKKNPTRHGSDVVFFSEPYELFSGRTEAIYRELLPQLCKLAASSGGKLVLKLHPFESVRERKRRLKKLLSRDELALVEVMSGPLTPALFDRAWFAITVQSTVAMECTLAGIPCFLCDWLSDSLFGYARQFAKFGAGHLLQSSEEIAAIPRILSGYQNSAPPADDLWSPIAPGVLREILSGVDASA